MERVGHRPGQVAKSEQKGTPLIISLKGARELLNNQLRRLHKGLIQGGADQAYIRWHSPLERGCKRVQVPQEKVKMWVPWNGLIVIGKRVELLDRNTQQPRMWDPRVDSGYWRPESVGKTVRKEKAGLSLKRTGSAADALQDSARETWGKQDVQHKIGAESKATGMTPEYRKGSASEEKFTSPGDNVGTSGTDLRPTVYKLQPNERQRLSGEKLVYGGEKRGSTVEKRVSFGEKRGSTGEQPEYRGEKRGSIREKRGSIGEKRGSTGEKRGSTGEKRGSTGEKLRSSREKMRLSREKLRTDGEDSISIRDKPGSSEEKLESNGEKLSRGEEDTEKVIKITGGERGIGFTDGEMEIPSESTKVRDKELEGIEEGVEIEGNSFL